MLFAKGGIVLGSKIIDSDFDLFNHFWSKSALLFLIENDIIIKEVASSIVEVEFIQNLD